MRKILLLALITSFFLAQAAISCVSGNFYESFIASYDLTGRYTHEYHPFVLQKTRESFLELEQALRADNFIVDSRMAIIGFQEEGVPPYETHWQRHALADEALALTNTGIALPTRNIFGYLTGFLLKDAQWLEQIWAQRDTTHTKIHSIPVTPVTPLPLLLPPLCTNIYARPITLFNDSAVLFQRHALGKDFGSILQARDRVEKAVYKKDLKAVLQELVYFWSDRYQGASKTGSQEDIATQDMLFSIDYARALMQGQAEIKKLFVGPDITYPIEVLDCQHEQATAHAQLFVQELQKELVPVNNQKTAYIFCSFVDGVGKSTLLNNIKNWQVHANNFSQYERCDNSSSQEATVFELKDNVYIADLPAQISHFTIKPDGLVFVAIDTVKEISEHTKKWAQSYAQEHKQELEEQFKKLQQQVAQEEKAFGELQDYSYNYALACHTLGVHDPLWVPFMFNNRHYVFHKQQPKKLRALVALSNAHSLGLKNIDPEQMLFMHGLSLPMHYTAFLDDLKTKLHQAGVGRVIFVDFLSMYPRSSRENIRVNFVLQYLKKLFKDHYKLDMSFYKHRTHKEQEICALLLRNLDDTVSTLVLETAFRWALYTIMQERFSHVVSALSGKELEERARAYTVTLLEQHGPEILEYARKRLETERELYNQNYALDRTYQTLIQFSFDPLIRFSEKLTTLFATYIHNSSLQELWQGMTEELPAIPQVTQANSIQTNSIKAPTNLPTNLVLNSGVPVSVVFTADLQARQQELLRPFIRIIKAQWYATLSNLLQATLAQTDQEGYILQEAAYAVPPLALKRWGATQVALVQKKLPLLDSTQQKFEPPVQFHVITMPGKQRQWGLFNNKPYCMQWDNPAVFFGIYAYGYNPIVQQKNTITKLVDAYRQTCVQAGRPTWGMPTAELVKQINEQQLWSVIKQEATAGQTGQGKTQQKVTTLTADDPRIPAIQLWARSIATLDMLAKDLDQRTMLLVRIHNQQDFIAALQLLEQVTLPQYFGIALSAPLFSDYTAVEPLLSWQELGARIV